MCDSTGMVKPVADLVEAAARDGLVRYKALDEKTHMAMLADTREVEPGCGVAEYCGLPIDFEQDPDATQLAALHTTPGWLAAWGRDRGIDITVEFTGVIIDTVNGWGGVPRPRDVAPVEFSDQGRRRHRTGAHDLLAPLIERVCHTLDTCESATVMAELERLARLPETDWPAPLAGLTSGGIKWHDGGQVEILTRKALGDRLRRRAEARRGSQRRAGPRT